MRSRPTTQIVLVGAALVLACFAAVAQGAPGDPKTSFNAKDQAYARSIPLRLAELPKSTWQMEATDFTQPNPPCVVRNYSMSALTATGRAGFTYSHGTAETIESDTTVFQSAAQGARAYAIATKPGLTSCFAEALAAEFRRLGAETTVLRAARLALTPSVAGHGVSTAASIIRLRARGNRGIGVVSAIQVFERRGRALASLAFIRTGSDWPSTEVSSLASTVAKRLAGG